jgi:hypothetical protein
MTHYRTSLAVVPASSLAPGKRGMGIQAVAAAETVTPSVIPAQAGIRGLTEWAATRQSKPLDSRLRGNDEEGAML